MRRLQRCVAYLDQLRFEISMVTQEAKDMYLPVSGHQAASCRLGGGLAYCLRCDADITDFEVFRRSVPFA